MGCEILSKENVEIDSVSGHGGFFKAPVVGQSAMSAAIGAPVTVMQNAGEGGAWGMAVLASYCVNKEPGETLDSFLEDKVFAQYTGKVCPVDEKAAEGFDRFMEGYVKCFGVEKAAIENF